MSVSVGKLDRKVILINSQFRESGTPSSFIWRFQERVENVRLANLRHFVFENGVYTVDDTNNAMYLSEGTGAVISGTTQYDAPLMLITIPNGYYDDETLASTIGLALTSISSQQGNGNLYFVQFTSTGILQISGQNDNINFAIGFTNGTTSFPLTASLLGFNNALTQNAYESETSGLYLTVQGDNPSQLASFDYLLVQSQKLGNDLSFFSSPIANPPPSAIIPPSASGCFAFIPNTTPNTSNSTIIYENVVPPYLETIKYPFSLDYVDISIVDKYGRQVLPRDNNITLVIELYTDKAGENVPTAWK
jgi:hypothetical protein